MGTSIFLINRSISSRSRGLARTISEFVRIVADHHAARHSPRRRRLRGRRPRRLRYTEIFADRSFDLVGRRVTQGEDLKLRLGRHVGLSSRSIRSMTDRTLSSRPISNSAFGLTNGVMLTRPWRAEKHLV